MCVYFVYVIFKPFSYVHYYLTVLNVSAHSLLQPSLIQLADDSSSQNGLSLEVMNSLKQTEGMDISLAQ